jgi:hypothetical protein
MNEQSKIIGHVLKKASKLDYIVMGGRSVLIHIPFHILYVLQQVLPDYFVETEWNILVRKNQESEEDDEDNKKKTEASGTDADYIKLCNMLTSGLGINVTITETDTPKKTIIKNHDTVLATISLDDGTYNQSMCIEPDRKHNGIKYASFCDTVFGLKKALQEHTSIKTIFQLRVLLNEYNNDMVEEPASALLKSLLDELNLDVRVKSDEVNIKTTCKPEPKNSQATKPASVGQFQSRVPSLFQQGPFQQPAFQQGPFQQGPFQQGPFQQGPFQQGPFQQGPFQQSSFQQSSFQKPSFQQPAFQQPAFQQPQSIFKTQESNYQPQFQPHSDYQPQDSNYQPQDSNYQPQFQPQESNYQPQESNYSNYQPQESNYSNYQPQESNYSNYQPQESNYQPQDSNYQGKKRKKSKKNKKNKKLKSKK